MALKSGKNAPPGFEEVVLSRTTGWTYWDLVIQPAWFIEKLALYLHAEKIANDIKAKQIEAESKLRGTKVPRIPRTKKYG